MREDAMLDLSLECARLAVHGEDYAAKLASGAESIMRADAGVGVITWRLAGGEDDPPEQPRANRGVRYPFG